MVECPECGADVPDGGRFCPACGLDLDAPPGDWADTPPAEEDGYGEPPPREPRGEYGEQPPQEHYDPPRREYDERYDEPPREGYGDRLPHSGSGRRPPRGYDEQYDEHPPPRGYDDPYGHPPGPPVPHPADHKLLLGGVVTVTLLGIVEGITKLAFADVLIEAAEEEGLGGPEITEGILAVSGGLGLLVSVAIIGLTAYYYRERVLPKRYFWVLLGTGAAGLLLVGSLFVTVLALFGIYGLVRVSE